MRIDIHAAPVHIDRSTGQSTSQPLDVDGVSLRSRRFEPDKTKPLVPIDFPACSQHMKTASFRPCFQRNRPFQLGVLNLPAQVCLRFLLLLIGKAVLHQEMKDGTICAAFFDCFVRNETNQGKPGSFLRVDAYAQVGGQIMIIFGNCFRVVGGRGKRAYRVAIRQFDVNVAALHNPAHRFDGLLGGNLTDR